MLYGLSNCKPHLVMTEKRIITAVIVYPQA